MSSAKLHPIFARWLAQVDAREAFASLAELVDDAAVFAVDSERRIVYWSPGAERILGYKARAVVGSDCHTANRCVECVRGCGLQEHGRLEGIELELFSSKGERVGLRKSARAIHDDEGRFLGGVEVLRPTHKESSRHTKTPETAESTRFHGLSSADPAMLQVFQTCRNVAETAANALIRGESGTGKELIAKALHAESPRSAGPFVAINCAALTPSLMESELFGHVRGAFTGAVRDRAGIFEQADGGTLFLDEVAELPLDMQAKLLRVLETGTIVPVGGRGERPVDVRIVSATHKSLRKAVASGEFREDLMFRLRVVPIFLPPLRDRRRDIALLTTRFIGEMNVDGPRVVDDVAPEAMRALLDHAWPGNVRELKNVIEYAFAVGRGPTLVLDELPPEFREAPAATPASRECTADSQSEEAARIRAVIAQHKGNLGAAAQALGMSRPTLWRKRKKYEI